jgi:malate dehydrogenase
MVRLDHNRAISQLAEKTGKAVTSIKKMTIWGNHSVTQFPDLYHAEVEGKSAYELVNDHTWYEASYIPTVAKRGAAIIEARGLSSAASAASAAIDHMKSWALGTPEGDWTSMAFVSDGSYGVPKGLVYGFPVTVKNGEVSIVQGLEINAFSRAKMDATAKELDEEREAVKALGLI